MVGLSTGLVWPVVALFEISVVVAGAVPAGRTDNMPAAAEKRITTVGQTPSISRRSGMMRPTVYVVEAPFGSLPVPNRPSMHRPGGGWRAV
jgi:hypothetical protein